jgi:hypothetical protein
MVVAEKGDAVRVSARLRLRIDVRHADKLKPGGVGGLFVQRVDGGAVADKDSAQRLRWLSVFGHFVSSQEILEIYPQITQISQIKSANNLRNLRIKI